MLLNNNDVKPSEEEPAKHSFYNDVKEFTTETTSHGVKYVFHAAYKTVRLIYMILWLSAVAYTMYIVCVSVNKYLSMETGTKIEELVTPKPDFLSQEAITHPTINVCPNNRVSKSKLNEKPGLEDLLAQMRGFDPENPSDKLFDFDDPTNEEYTKYENETWQDIIWNGRPRIGLLQCTHYTNICHELKAFNNENYTVWKPHWDDQYEHQDREKHFEWEMSLSGACYRINPKGSIYTKEGDYGEVSLIFFTDLNDYSEDSKSDPMYGYTVTFTDNGTYSSTMTSGFFMSPGNVYKADLRKYREHNIGPPAGKCNPHMKTNIYGTHSRNSCTMRNRDEFVNKTCGCVHLLPPCPENEPEVSQYFRPCSLREWAECGYNATKTFTDMFVDLENEYEDLSKCNQACMEIWYEATISSSRLSKYYAGKKVDLLPRVVGRLNGGSVPDYEFTTETVYENVMVLKVLFSSIQESNYKEYVKYDYTQLIGDVGGQMGMLLGASLFTVIEFVHFLIKTCWRCACRPANPGGDGFRRQYNDQDL